MTLMKSIIIFLLDSRAESLIRSFVGRGSLYRSSRQMMRINGPVGPLLGAFDFTASGLHLS